MAHEKVRTWALTVPALTLVLWFGFALPYSGLVGRPFHSDPMAYRSDIDAGPANPPPSPRALAPAAPFTLTDVEVARAELQRQDVGRTLLQIVHPTGAFQSGGPLDLTLSSDGRTLSGRTTVEWLGTTAARYRTTFAFTLTATNALLHIEADTARFPVKALERSVAEKELGRMNAALQAAIRREATANAGHPVSGPSRTSVPGGQAGEKRILDRATAPTPPTVTSPIVGVWDVALTPTGDAVPLPAKLASFHGNGRFTMGFPAAEPDLTFTYRYESGVLSRRNGQAVEESLAVAWEETGEAFSLAVPQGTLRFRRKPVWAVFKEVKAVLGEADGGPFLEVQAYLRVDHAPGLPVVAQCRVFDDEGRPVRARAGSALADPDGLLVPLVHLTPTHDRTEFKGFRLPIPLAELPEGLSGSGVRFTLAVWCPRDARDVTDAPAWGASRLPAPGRVRP